MRTSSTFSILFWIYAARAKNNQTDIYVRITVNGKRVNISLKKKIDVDSWDVKSQKVKGNGKTAREINHYLNEIRSTLFQCYRNLKLENRVLSPKLIKARFLGEDKIIHSLQDIIDYHNETMASKLYSKTMCHYRTSKKYVLEYLEKKYKSSDIQGKNTIKIRFLSKNNAFITRLKTNKA